MPNHETESLRAVAHPLRLRILWPDFEAWQELLRVARELSNRLHEAATPPHWPGSIRTSTTISMVEVDDKL